MKVKDKSKMVSQVPLKSDIANKKPVLYLDIDDCILMFPNGTTGHEWLKTYYETYKYGIGAPGVREFIPWALKHFEIRWLTMWTMCGRLDSQGNERLEKLTGVSSDLWEQIINPLSHRYNKIEGIDWKEIESGRKFIWLEDELLSEEIESIKNMNVLDSYIRCNVSEDPYALYKAWHVIKERFQLPGEINEH